ncbi:MAG: hypothetical protein EU535_05010 [Promethearchaeota archaeon]|nr:MAG: hypothetical protein EU535_05010 [Candidatus Lokiarchaeota archaeon]
MELTQIEFLNGIFAIFIVFTFYFIGLRLIYKYFKLKEKKILYLGVAIPFMGNMWLAISVTFMSILLTSNSISPEVYFLLGYGFPLGMVFWLTLFTELMYEDKQKLIVSLFIIYWIIMEIIFFMLLLTDTTLLGVFNRPLTPVMSPFLAIRSFITLILLIITGILFYRESHKSDNAEVRVKGTLFLSGIILFMLGALTFVISGVAFIPLIFFIPSLFMVYGALILPDWMKKIFLK